MLIETQRSRVSVLRVSLSGQRKPLPPPMVCACEGGVSVHVWEERVCMCVGGRGMWCVHVWEERGCPLE